MEIKMIKPTDVDYPLAMNLVPFAEKYKLIQIGDLVVVPLFQVIDAISEVKAYIVVHDGVECCPTCMKPIKGTFTKADMLAMLTELKSNIDELASSYDVPNIYVEIGMKEIENEIQDLIQQKINFLSGL